MGAVLDRGYNYSHHTADGQAKAGKGVLHTLVINKAATTAGVITLYDSLTEAGTVIAAITVPIVGAGAGMPITLAYDVQFDTGLYVGFDGTIAGADVTATFI